MSYHPLMGVTFFFVIVFIAFFIGRKTSLISNNKIKKNTIIIFNNKNRQTTDAISPDASWLNRK